MKMLDSNVIINQTYNEASYTFDFTSTSNLSPNIMNAIINSKFNTSFIQYLMQHSVTISSLQQKRKRKKFNEVKNKKNATRK